jgi:hypothetical protein
MFHSGGGNRLFAVRSAVCQVCKTLTALHGGNKELYHDIQLVRSQIEQSSMVEPPPTQHELDLIYDTEGTAVNGGGELEVQRNELGAVVSIRWQLEQPKKPEDDIQNDPRSPLADKASPGAPGQGRTLQGLGAVGSGSVGI